MRQESKAEGQDEQRLQDEDTVFRYLTEVKNMTFDEAAQLAEEVTAPQE